MRALYINIETLIANSTLTVRNNDHQVIYLVTGHWGNSYGRFVVNSVYGDELARINQLKFGMLPKFELIQAHQRICTFIRPLNITNEIFYLPKLNWIVRGNLKHMTYKIATVNHQIMRTQVLKEVPQRLAINIDQVEHEPLCLCILAILNYWAQTRFLDPSTPLDQNPVCT